MASQEHHSLTASVASKTDPSSAARALTAPAEDIISTGSPESDIEGGLRPVWESIINVAADTEYQSQEHLVSIVRAVQQQKLTNDGASEVEVWGEKVKVWSDLPLFGASVRDAWNRGMATRRILDIRLLTLHSSWHRLCQRLLCKPVAQYKRLPSTPNVSFSIYTYV